MFLMFLRQRDHLQEMHILEMNGDWKLFVVVFVNDEGTRKAS